MVFEIREVNNIVIYNIEGEIRIDEEMPVILHDHVKSQLEIGKRYFLFNLENVNYIDSFGVGQLIGSLTSIMNVGGKLKLTNLIPRIRFIFEVTGLVKVFIITPDEEAAIRNYSD
jgi:stage II sporulation protein AA (anti-sigma F factor antagonist)